MFIIVEFQANFDEECPITHNMGKWRYSFEVKDSIPPHLSLVPYPSFFCFIFTCHPCISQLDTRALSLRCDAELRGGEKR